MPMSVNTISIFLVAQVPNLEVNPDSFYNLYPIYHKFQQNNIKKKKSKIQLLLPFSLYVSAQMSLNEASLIIRVIQLPANPP